MLDDIRAVEPETVDRWARLERSEARIELVLGLVWQLTFLGIL